MEWLLDAPQLHNAGSNLIGMQFGNTYCTHETCQDTLVELLAKLSTEDRTLRTFRRALGFSQIIQKDLVPLLINEKQDYKVIDAAVRLLVNLTIPVECLLPMEIMARSDAGRHTVFELTNLLTSAKEAFVDPKSTRSILEFMRKLLDNGEQLTVDQCEGVNNCLLLVRNILHIPEPCWAQTGACSGAAPTAAPVCSKQNVILWNLFSQGVDKVLINLMTCPQKGYWSITLVQLIALTYKDQHVGTLQKLLSVWVETSVSESSEDNESNTSPPNQRSGDSSPMLTSDPTSDSSDNSSGSTNKSGPSDASTTKHTQRPQTDQDMKTSTEISRTSQSTGPSTGSGGRGKGGVGKSQHKKERHHGDQDSRTFQAACTKHADSAEPMACTSSSTQPEHSRSSGVACPQSPSRSAPPPSPAFSAASQCSSGVSSAASPKSANSPAESMHGSCKRLSISSELSDCGYATQPENPETVSTSSNEEDLPKAPRNVKPVHQKPHNPNKHNRPHKPPQPKSVQDKNDWRKKKLVKRSRANIVALKALMSHTPSDEDISHLLKEFTVDFLLKGYASLVHELHAQLLSELGMPVDTSHFFWLVTYFLKFAAQLDLELETISPVLSYKVVSYLTFEGVNLCEQLQMALLQQEMDLKPCLRRLHLVVTAIREFIQAVETYRKASRLNIKDKEQLDRLQAQMCDIGDLRCLFVLLLRQYSPSLHSKQYLQDLVATNHVLLTFLESRPPTSKPAPFDIVDHIKQFTTAEMMLQYGRLLESFRDNGKFINDCVFTMMHHVSGDLSQSSALFQPNILKTFSLIWEEDFEDWSDLIEYVIHKFVNTPRLGHPMLPLGAVENMLAAERASEMSAQPPAREKNTCRWTKEECDTLYWYFVQSTHSVDSVGHILDLYNENGSTCKTRVGIIEQLYSQDIIAHAQYLELLKQETVVLQGQSGNNSGSSTPTAVEAGSGSNPPPQDDDISSLIALLLSEKHALQLHWLQAMLLEMCYIKLYQNNLLAAERTMEPVPYHYNLMRQSVPLVPWSLEQSTVLTHPPFVLLLHKLGFHLPADVGKVFPRIPHFWTAQQLYTTALKLGPVNPGSLKFEVQQLHKAAEEDAQMLTSSSSPEDERPSCLHSPQKDVDIPRSAATLSTVRFAPLPAGTSNWLQVVAKSKLSSRESPPPMHLDHLDSEVSKMSISDDDASIYTLKQQQSPSETPELQ